MTPEIEAAREVAAMGPVTTKMSPSVDRDAAAAMLVRDHNTLRAGFLALDAELAAVEWLMQRYCIGRHEGHIVAMNGNTPVDTAATAVGLRAKLEVKDE